CKTVTRVIAGNLHHHVCQARTAGRRSPRPTARRRNSWTRVHKDVCARALIVVPRRPGEYVRVVRDDDLHEVEIRAPVRLELDRDADIDGVADRDGLQREFLLEGTGLTSDEHECEHKSEATHHFSSSP